jgi:predicted GNAT superfamily acetyltransferase
MPTISIGPVEDLGASVAVVDLFAEVWASEPGNPPVRPELVVALATSGAYVVTARSGERLVGASLAWLGVEHGRPTLHSHMTAVRPDMRGSGVGLALKRHQRAWCLERGIDTARWTFDPLVRRNAWFNLTKLGATITGYLVDCYGPLTDSINAGDDTDRVVASWDLDGARARAASAGTLEAPDAGALRAAGACVLLVDDGDGGPQAGAELVAGEPALCATPVDIEAVRAADPALARAWRRAVRDTLGTALDRGWRAEGVSRSGWYVLEPPEPGRPGAAS